MIATDKIAHATEAEIYQIYRDTIIPFIVTLEVLDNEFPVEILNEIRAIFSHLASYKLDGAEHDLHLASRHLKRATLDCYKYMCVAIEEKVQEFRHDYRHVNLSLADNGAFLPELNRLERLAHRATIDVRQTEGQHKVASSSEESDIDSLYEGYATAWTAYEALKLFLDNSSDAIAFASNQSKKSSYINFISIAIGVAGILIGLVGVLF